MFGLVVSSPSTEEELNLWDARSNPGMVLGGSLQNHKTKKITYQLLRRSGQRLSIWYRRLWVQVPDRM
jgi:hypothetical protein